MPSHTPKLIVSIWRKLWCLFTGKKSTSSLMFFWKYCKEMQTYFGYFGHVWLSLLKMIVSTCRKHQCLSACPKQTLWFTYFLRYGAIHKVCAQIGGGGNHDEIVQVHTEGVGFKLRECIHISTVYVPFLKIFLIKKQKNIKIIKVMQILLTLHLNS